MKRSSKLISIFGLMLAAIISVSTLAGCDAVGGIFNKKTEATEAPYVDQGEQGNYYAYVGVNTLSLNLSENKVEFKAESGTLTGTYSFDGENLVITFDGETAGVKVTYSGDSLSFNYKGSSYTLYLDKTFQVSFNTNGGSTVASIAAQNGKALSKPQDPTKDGYQFIGWYSDAACTLKYDFASLVTGEATIYAKFVENTDPSTEYKVEFVSGAEGVELDSVTTLEGTVYNLPEVNVQGKTFLGWWVSDFDDAKKLTYKFEEGMTLKEDTVLYAVYQENAPAVSYSAGKISWDSKGVNKNYSVTIRYANDPEADAVYTRSVTTNYIDFNFDEYAANEYEITVQYGDYKGTCYVANGKVPTVCKIEIDGYEIKWQPVEGATNYYITVECGMSGHEHTMLDLGDATSYDFYSCIMPENGINFQITAGNKDGLPSTSKTVNCYRELDKVENVEINADQQLTWKEVAGATTYKVEIKDENGNVKAYTVESNSLDVSEYYGKISFVVTPELQGYYSYKTESEITKTSLSTPKNIMLTGYTVVWDEVKDAKSYVMEIGGIKFESNTNSYTLTEADCDKFEEFKITVKAIAESEANNSLFSKEVTVSKEGVTEISYQNGVITWNSVPGVAKYAVRVDEGEVVIVEGKNKLELRIESGMGRKIYVTTADSQGNYKEADFFQVSVDVYAINFNTTGGYKMDSIPFVKGDTITELPDGTQDGYNFVGWYETEAGATTLADPFTAKTFDYDSDITVYAAWTGKTYTPTLDYQAYGEGSEKSKDITYGSTFTLPVPEVNNTLYAFVGWYSQPYCQGERYTDEQGTGLRNWRDYGNTELYAGYTEIFEFTLINNEKEYSVKKGPGIEYVTTITVPYEYNGLPVTTIEPGAFASCSILVEIRIPETIKTVSGGETGANMTGSIIQYSYKFERFVIYEVEGAIKEDVVFKAIDGVLLYNNTTAGTGWEIKYFPYYTRTGVYTVPSIVSVIPGYVFRSSTKITEFVIPANVQTIGEQAFYSCTGLTTITFLETEEGEKEVGLSIGSKAFQSCSALVEINLPARLQEITVDALSACTKLERVNIIGTSANQKYATVEGALTNAEKTKIIFYPRAAAGVDGVYTTPVGISTIGANAFESCKNIYVINISAQVTMIEANAFKSCTNVYEINFLGTKDDARLTICEAAFYGIYLSTSGATTLTELKLPANLIKLEKNAFGGCSKLTLVELYAVDENLDFATNAFGSTATTPVFYVTDLFIAKDVHEFEITGVFGQKLLNVVVEEGSKYYAAVDGVLYDSNITSVLYYPTDREGAFVIPSTVTTIGARVFQAKTGLTSITIPKSVTSIGEGAFYGCTGLLEVIFEEGGTDTLVMDEAAFRGCSKVTSYKLPSRLKEISKYCFYGNSKLESITIPEGVETIGEFAFQSCSVLATVNLPSTLKVLAESVGTITGDKDPRIRVFETCSKLETITIAEGNQYFQTIDGVLYQNLYENKEDLTELTSIALILCPAAKGGVINIPKNTSKIEARAFYNNKNLTEINFPDGVNGSITIGNYAFYYCEQLTKCILPEGLTEVSANAFYYCKALKEVTIPSTVTRIGAKAFYNCVELETVTFAEGGTESLVFDAGNSEGGDYSSPTYMGTFYNCPKITTIVFPDRTTEIQAYAFAAMPGLTSVTLPSELQTLGNYAFYQNTNLTEIKFSNGKSKLETIGTYTFAYAPITSLVLPEGMKVIGVDMFAYCKQLTSVVIPTTVESIGNYAFYQTSSLTSLTFAEGSNLKKIDSYVFGYSALEHISFPQSLETLGNYSCYHTEKLKSVTFEGSDTAEGCSLRAIGQRAFQYSGIESFTFPNCGTDATTGKPNHITFYVSTTIASPKATDSSFLFEYCKKLTTVTISPAVLSMTDMFTKCSSIKNVVIAEGSESFKVDDEKPIILSIDEKNIQFIFGRQDGEFIVPEGVEVISAYAFANQTNITKLVLPKTLKSIGNNAFQNCYSLTEVVFPEGCLCDTFGTYVFAGCRSLKTINLPTAATTIGQYMFLDCISLESIEIPSNYTKIDNYAFVHTYSLKTINIPSSVTTLGNYAFSMSGLTEIALPEGLTTTGTYCFQKSYDLKKVSIPASLTSIANQMFTECTSLTDVTFAEGCTTVGGYMFYKCYALENITLPESIEIVNYYAFQNCTSLKEITIPANVKQFGTTGTTSLTTTPAAGVFDGCTALEKVTFEGELITFIGTYAFRNCASLTQVNIPESVVYIGNEAFKGCASLTSITIPAKVQVLGVSTSAGSAFEGCTALETVTIQSTVLKNVQAKAFKDCTSLKSIVLPSTVVVLNGYAFQNCTSLVSVEVNGKLTTVGSYLFDNCTSLTSVKLANTNTKFGTYMFRGCTALESIDLPTSLTDMSTYTFQNCTSLKSISIPKGVTKLGTSGITGYNFDGCTSLESVTFNATSFTIIGGYVFRNCKALKDITLPSTLTTLGGYSFYGCESLTSVTIPKGIKYFSTSATAAGYTFYGCTSLKEVIFQTTALTAINSYTFCDCFALDTITIPSTVTTIGAWAFYRNKSLTTLVIPAKVTSIGSAAFNVCDNLTNLDLTGNTKYTNYNGYAVLEDGYKIITMFNVPEADYVLPEGTVVGSYAFWSVSGIKTLTLPQSMTSIPSYAFATCYADKIIVPNTCTEIGSYAFKGATAETIILGTADKTLGTYAFQSSKVKNLENLDTVTSIGNYCFNDTSNLLKLEFSEKLTTIGTYAFKDCNLQEITLKEGLTDIGNYAFNNADIATITIPSTVKTIGTYAFKDAAYLTEVIMNEGLESIGTYAFQGTKITSLTFPSTLTTVGNELCMDLESLETVVINGNVMGTYMFDGCINLKSVTFNGTELTAIPNGAFMECASLTSIQLPDTVQTLGTSAFDGCTSLKTVNTPAALITVGSLAFHETAIEEFIASPVLEQILSKAFQGCTSLKRVVLNEGLITIGTATTSTNVTPAGLVFDGCIALESINLPSTLYSIGESSFAGCTSIKKIIIPAELTVLGGLVFDGWTEDQIVATAAALYDVTGSWYESSSYTLFKHYWDNCNAQWIWEYKE